MAKIEAKRKVKKPVKELPKDKIPKPHMIGNKFWMQRSKHGRDSLFESAELIWEASCEYFDWVENNPLIAEEVIKSGDLAGTIVYTNKMRPFTWQGLTGYLDCNVEYFTDFERSLQGKTDQKSIDFCRVIKRIRQIIYQQKFEGAAAGFLNPMIISRDLGLKDATKQEVTSEVKATVTSESKVQVLLPDNSRGNVVKTEEKE